jgi:hypothetical protein
MHATSNPTLAAPEPTATAGHVSTCPCHPHGQSPTATSLMLAQGVAWAAACVGLPARAPAQFYDARSRHRVPAVPRWPITCDSPRARYAWPTRSLSQESSATHEARVVASHSQISPRAAARIVRRNGPSRVG